MLIGYQPWYVLCGFTCHEESQILNLTRIGQPATSLQDRGGTLDPDEFKEVRFQEPKASIFGH